MYKRKYNECYGSGGHGGRGKRGHWMRRMASVPKGYLRHQVLNLLNEKPMSGAELIREIESKTEHGWKPSPGSIYPLLSWLLDSGYTVEVPEQESGVKRYELTDAGREFREEHIKRREEHHERMESFGPMFPGLNGYPEEAKDLLKSMMKFQKTSWSILKRMKKDYSEDDVKEIKKILDEFTAKLEVIAKKKDA
ncbi:MAG: helix-turn-helix transcriptional regulator [Candidatus Thorarchaeota archaeon]|jgi:DNA-binding PadR family transcriptional regulator